MALAPSHLIFLGTYTRAGGRGIYSVRLDSATGKLTTPILAAETTDPSWVTLSPDKRFLYAVHPSEAQIVGFKVDADSGTLAPLAPMPAGPRVGAPCHLAVDHMHRVIVGTNYGEGYGLIAALQPNGAPGKPTLLRHSGRSVHPTRQDKPHPHSVTVSADNRHVILCDLGLDRIFTYVLDASSAALVPANPPSVATEPGAGPRHFKFSSDGHHGYAINELGNTVTVYDYDPANGALTLKQSISTLPPDFTAQNTTAEVRIHPNGKYLYGSNRGHDSIVVFAIEPGTGKLSLVEMVPSGGKTPRNFALSPDGRWLVCAHQDSEELNVFRVNASTGRLARSEHSARVSMCVCVQFYD